MRYIYFFVILFCISDLAFGSGISQATLNKIATRFGVTAIPVVSFRLYFTLGRAGAMKLSLGKRFRELSLFLLSEGLFYLGFVGLGIALVLWGIEIMSVATFLVFVAIAFALVQHYRFGPKDDGIPPRLLYAASLFVYPAVISLI